MQNIIILFCWEQKPLIYLPFDICLSSGCACCQRGGVASGIITGRTGNRLWICLYRISWQPGDRLVLDLPQVLSKLTLLVNSGMVLGMPGSGCLLQETELSIRKCRTPAWKSKTASWKQTLTGICRTLQCKGDQEVCLSGHPEPEKGNEELAYFLKDLPMKCGSKEKWSKTKREKSQFRLLLPMMLILIESWSWSWFRYFSRWDNKQLRPVYYKWTHKEEIRDDVKMDMLWIGAKPVFTISGRILRQRKKARQRSWRLFWLLLLWLHWQLFKDKISELWIK